MVQRCLLIVLIAAQVAPPLGGGLCASEAPPAAVVVDCCGGCDTTAACECCRYEADEQPADRITATLTKVQQTVPHLFVVTEALPQPTAIPHPALGLERTITPREFVICLTRAERAPPA